MSHWEEAPVGRHEGDWWQWTDEERETYLVDSFAEFASIRRAAKGHNADGWFADEAGSEKCLALGHTLDEEQTLIDDDAWLPTDQHPYGWDNVLLCLGTRYGTACTECEGECEWPEPVNLWALPGVSGAKETVRA